MNVKLTWPVVAALAILVGGIVLLSWLKVDATALMTLALVVVGGGVGYQIQQGQQIKDNTNGNNTALLEGVRELARMLAVAHPVAPEVVADIAANAHQPDTPRPVSSPPLVRDPMNGTVDTQVLERIP